MGFVGAAFDVRSDSLLTFYGQQDATSSAAQKIIEAEQRAAGVEVKLEVVQHRAERAEKKAADLAQAEADVGYEAIYDEKS